MALASIILGSTTGLLAFLLALFQLDYGVMQAFAVYLATGTGTVAVLLAIAFLPANRAMPSIPQPR